MFKKILIATDLSSAAFAVVKDLGKLKAYGAEEFLLLQCIGQRETDSFPDQSAAETLNKNLKEQRKTLEGQGFKAATRVVFGPAKKEICRIAEAEDFSLIVSGVESCSLLSEPFMGGAAYEIIHYCPRPVLLIRLEETRNNGITSYEPVRGSFMEHILFPTDFSDTAAQAFDVVKVMVAQGTQKVTLMHVQEQARIDPYLLQQLPQFNEKDEFRLNEMKAVLQGIADVEVDTVLFYGSPSRDILEAIEDRNIQLVVMGSQGRGYVKELFLGSVSHNIARRAKSSVLLIPPRKIGTAK